MGMYGTLRQVTVEELERLTREPEFVSELADDSDVAEALDLGKCWHALHFGLTGDAELDVSEPQGPLADAILGVSGRKVGNESDWGYGPPMALTPERVAEIHRALQGFSLETFRQRLLGPVESFAEVYGFEESPVEVRREGLPEFERLLREVKELYAEAASEGHGVLTYLS